MKKLFALLLVLVFAVACAPSSDDVGKDTVNIEQIAELEKANVENEIILTEWNIIEKYDKTYIFNAYESYEVVEDGIMYLYEVPLAGGGSAAVPCLQEMYDCATGIEQVYGIEKDLVSYYKQSDDKIIYHKEVFYKDVNTPNPGKKIAALK